MAQAKVKLNSAGVKALLADKGVRDELTRQAQRVQRAAPGTKLVQATSGGYRAVVHVVDDQPGALYREATTGALARALDEVSR